MRVSDRGGWVFLHHTYIHVPNTRYFRPVPAVATPRTTQTVVLVAGRSPLHLPARIVLPVLCWCCVVFVLFSFRPTYCIPASVMHLVGAHLCTAFDTCLLNTVDVRIPAGVAQDEVKHCFFVHRYVSHTYHPRCIADDAIRGR